MANEGGLSLSLCDKLNNIFDENGQYGQGRSYIQAIEAYASLNKLKSKPSTQIMVLM